MKKVLFAAAAVAAMAACAKTTEVYEDSAEIGLAPHSYVATKANGPIKDATYPTDANFKVFAAHTESPAGTAFAAAKTPFVNYLTNVKFVNKTGNTWGGETAYYWPKTGSLFFAGYSPAEAVMTSAAYSFENTVGLDIKGFAQGAYAGATAQPSADMVDLMWFERTETSANTGAPAVLFKHALSYITFNFKANQASEGLFTLTEVVIDGVDSKGDFVSATQTWTPSAPQAVNVFKGSQAMTVSAFTADNLLFIPQTAKSVKVVFEQLPYVGADPQSKVVGTKTFTLEGGDGASAEKTSWLLGKHYTYNFTFTAEEIILTPSVEEWVKVADKETTIK